MSEILFVHDAQGVVDEKLQVDSAGIDAIARLGGNTCATGPRPVEMATPKLS